MFTANFIAVFFSLLFFVRFLSACGQKNKLKAMKTAQMSLFLLFFLLLLVKFYVLDIRFLVTALVLLPFGTLYSLELIEKYKRRSWTRYRLPFVRTIILRMTAGESFRNALDAACGQLEPKIIPIFKTIVGNCMFGVSNPRGSSIFSELQRVIAMGLSQRQNVLFHLNDYREKLEMEYRFYSKVKCVSSQARIQTWAIVFVYLVALTYTVHKYGFLKFQSFLLVSAILMLMGLALSFYTIRSFKWRV